MARLNDRDVAQIAAPWSGYPTRSLSLALDVRDPGEPRPRRNALCLDLSAVRAEYVYVAAAGDSVVKVGWSQDPISRFGAFANDARARGFTGPARLLRIYYGDHSVEAAAHRFMRPDVVRGREWFSVGPRFRILLNRLDRRLKRPSNRIPFLVEHLGKSGHSPTVARRVKGGKSQAAAA